MFKNGKEKLAITKIYRVDHFVCIKILIYSIMMISEECFHLMFEFCSSNSNALTESMSSINGLQLESS